MPRYHPANERIKREYFCFLKEAKRHSVETVDAVAQALARFEADTHFRDFHGFRQEQAVAFKRHLAARDSRATGGKLSKATQYATLAHLKRFFQWLATQPGYKSKLKYTDAEYFNLSDNDARVATARRPQRVPTLEQVQHVIRSMPSGTDIERRDRALIAFALLTGARDSALATMRLGHVDLAARSVLQDARTVKTKFAKTFTTYFFPVGDDVQAIFEGWVRHLREERLSGNDDPLFPATRVAVGDSLKFEVIGLDTVGWDTAAPVRAIFKRAFEGAGLKYYNPHSLRKTLVQLGEQVCRTPEEFKAWSQNLGHEGVLTTFASYGQVALGRQGDLIRALGQAPAVGDTPADVDLQGALALIVGKLGIKPEVLRR